MDEICLSCNERLLIMGMICLSCNDRLLIMGMICLSCNARLLIMGMIFLSCNDRLLINDHGDDMLIVSMIGVLIMYDVLQNYVTMKVIVITT